MNLFISGDDPLREALELRIRDRMLHGMVVSSAESDMSIIFDHVGDRTPIDSPTILVTRWDDSSEPTARGSVCVLRIRDMLAPGREHPLGESDIDAMLDALSIGQPSIPTLAARHWVAQRDVVDAIESLIEHPDPWGHSVEVCGRRCWDPIDLFAELSMLWRRFEHSSSATIDVEDLKVKPPQTSAGAGEGPEPDHSGLHRLLEQINGVGWKPLTPMRIALMELLSDRLDV